MGFLFFDLCPQFAVFDTQLLNLAVEFLGTGFPVVAPLPQLGDKLFALTETVFLLAGVKRPRGGTGQRGDEGNGDFVHDGMTVTCIEAESHTISSLPSAWLYASKVNRGVPSNDAPMVTDVWSSPCWPVMYDVPVTIVTPLFCNLTCGNSWFVVAVNVKCAWIM